MAEDTGSEPIRKIDDATYGTQPKNRVHRWLLGVKRWVLLDANRWVLTAALLALITLVIVVVGTYGPVSTSSFLTEGTTQGSIFVELMKAIVSVVVIVLSINQIVLSPGLGPVDAQRERFEQSIELRRRVETEVDVDATPASPAGFLAMLLDEIETKAERLAETTTVTGNRELAAETQEFADTVGREARVVRELLVGCRFGTFEVTSAAVRFAITQKVRSLEAIRRGHEEALTGQTADAFEEMDNLLELFTISREYLKTVYIRSEYVSLSEGLLYSGLPALVVAYLAANIYSPSVFPGQILGVQRQLLTVAVAVALSLAPFVFMIAYVFRLAAMSRSTLFVGPFDARRTREDLSEDEGHGR
jgi:hypothetical protein